MPLASCPRSSIRATSSSTRSRAPPRSAGKSIGTVTLYGKPGCHLCAEARAEVLSAREHSDFDLVEVDITLDPALHREYGERIPVVEIDGVEAFRYRVDRDRLIELLGSGPEAWG